MLRNENSQAFLDAKSDCVDFEAGVTTSCPRISCLPTELLIEVFTLCASNEPFAPLSLSSVCQLWRGVVHTSPKIWHFVYLEDSPYSCKDQSSSQVLGGLVGNGCHPEVNSHSCLASCRAQALLWCSRSFPLPFDIEIKVESTDMLLPLLFPLLPDFPRWRYLTMTGDRTETVNMSRIRELGPTLELLVIHVQSFVSQHAIEDAPPSTFTVSDNPWSENPWKPNPWGLTLGMNVRVTSLPDPTLVPSLHFTYLDIHESSPIDVIDTQPFHLLKFLTACSALECFKYKGWPHDNEVVDANLPVANLPRLHTLRLRNTCSTRAILSHLLIPSLTELRLEYLNVDFELPGHHDEEGDSEDDAHDFSQSPSSDHRTGMGLRTLISRCNPPLKVLDMDYSDMRTKDFQWCFDRLTMLEKFRIIASDMSDNVVRLFKPFCMKSGQDTNGTQQLRLPKLTNLEFHNCGRLSGDAIVDAFSTRVNFTDGSPGPTLINIAIVGCEAFSLEHIYRLSLVLGSRLRVAE